ncbi:MAG: thioesterase family protein [Bacteroidota bacterium]
MNLYFRLMRILVLALRQDILDIFDTSITRFRVWPTDMDINRHMNNAKYLSLMDLGRLDFLIRTGLGRVVLKNKWMPVLGSSNVRWRRALHFFQKFELHTRLLCWDEKWFYIEQRVIKDDQVMCHAIVKGIFVGSKGSIAAQKLISNNRPELLSPPMPESVKHWILSEQEMSKTLKDH